MYSFEDATKVKSFLLEIWKFIKLSKLIFIIVSQLVTKKGFFILFAKKLNPPAVPSGLGSSINDILNFGFTLYLLYLLW